MCNLMVQLIVSVCNLANRNMIYQFFKNCNAYRSIIFRYLSFENRGGFDIIRLNPLVTSLIKTVSLLFLDVLITGFCFC